MIDTMTMFQNLSTDEDKWIAANEMPIDPYKFATMTHYNARMFGMLSGDDISEKYGSFVINECVRESLWRVLYDVQIYTENFVGYNLSRRYHKVTMPYPLDPITKVKWPGLAAVDTAPKWVDHNLVVDLSPFVQVAPTVTGTVDPVVTLDHTLIDNPNDVILRQGAAPYAAFPIKKGAYPKRTGTLDWEVQIASNTVSYNPADGVAVQSTKYVYVDVDWTSMGVTGKIVPVFKGTHEIIPYVRVESLTATSARYWFNIWAVVDPAFATDDQIDLISGEFYKLMPSITFMEYQEVTSKALLVITQRDDCCQGCEECEGCNGVPVGTYQVSTRVVDAARGLIGFQIDGELITDPDTHVTTLDTTSQCSVGKNPCYIYTLTYSYFTDPANLPDRASGSIPNLLRAIMHRVAADLPMNDCLCEIQYGFIYQCQQMYATMATTISGTNIVTNKYGNLHGHKVYQELLGNAYVMKTMRLKGSADERLY